MNRSGLKILIITLLISTLGILTIYSDTYQRESSFWQMIYRRQLIWVFLGLLIFMLALRSNYRRLWDLTYILYALAIFLLFLVFVSGIVRLGAQRWLRLVWINFQPSETVKLIMIIFFARYFSAKSVGDISPQATKYGISRAIILPLVFLAIPVFFVFEQPDLGSGAMMFFIFIAMAFLGNVRRKSMVIFLVAIFFSLPWLWHFLRDYQRERLIVFLNPYVDPLGAGYTIIQSKITIGSGGILGKGWLAGTQNQLHFLPEAHTDFIFATFVEEWGLLGGLVLLLLYYLLIREGIRIAESTTDHFGRLLALGISCTLAMQVSINVAMNLGLAPVVGLPLPLMSYGGSSVATTFLSLGILVNIHRRRAVF